MPRPPHTPAAARHAAALRKDMPWSEARLWTAIRRRQTGARFRRQVPIGRWIADFASFDPRLVIEVDGPSHDYEDDRERTGFLESKGFTVLRFDNEDIRDNLSGVFFQIEDTITELRG